MFKGLEELVKIIRERKNSSPDKSYTNKLLNDKNLSKEKVKEEIKELFEAVEKNTNKIHESADVLYHLLVYLEANGIKIEDVMEELKNRKLFLLIFHQELIMEPVSEFQEKEKKDKKGHTQEIYIFLLMCRKTDFLKEKKKTYIVMCLYQ